MIRQKKTKGYHNIFILILILVILFFFGRIILNRNSYVKNRIRTSEFVKLELSSQPSSENNFLVHAIYQVFPIKKVEKKLNIEMPICEQAYLILFEGKDPEEAVNCLMNRVGKHEHTLSQRFFEC